MTRLFEYDEAVKAEYPNAHAGLLHARGLVNRPSTPDLLTEYGAEQTAARTRIAETPIADHRSVIAWRRAFTQFGAQPTRYRNAAESLMRRLSKQGEIPTISTLVDIGNLVSIRYALPVAVVDLAQISGGITVRFAHGNEGFTDLGSSDEDHPEQGEVIFVDGDDAVVARRWCWRQSAHSATSGETTDALFIVEALHEEAETDIRSALDDLAQLVDRHQDDPETEMRFLGSSL